MAQNDQKYLPHPISQELYLIWYDYGFWYTCVQWWYLQQFFFSFFQNSDFSFFSKFINKCQKEILRCVPPSRVWFSWLWTYFIRCSSTSIVDFEHVMPAGIIQKFCFSFHKKMCSPWFQRKLKMSHILYC